jgi:hypothetical protein
MPSPLVISLQEDNFNLEEVIVTGYGSLKKEAYAGSASILRWTTWLSSGYKYWPVVTGLICRRSCSPTLPGSPERPPRSESGEQVPLTLPMTLCMLLTVCRSFQGRINPWNKLGP